MIVFDSAVVDALVISGTGYVNFDNIMFRKLSSLNGRYIINNSVDNAVFADIYSVANTDVAINNSGDKAVFVGQVINSVTKIIEDNGLNTYTNFYSNGGSVQKSVNDEAITRANADTLLEQSIEDETVARIEANNVINQAISAEVLARAEADSAIGIEIDNEALARVQKDTELEQAIGAEILA
jgi:hypothetical protein